MRRPKRPVSLIIAAAVMALSLQCLVAYTNPPPTSFARSCGNCALGTAGAPMEAGILASIVFFRCLHRRHLFRGDICWWVTALAGILLTPFLIGLPIFACSLVMLTWPDAKTATAKRPAER